MGARRRARSGRSEPRQRPAHSPLLRWIIRYVCPAYLIAILGAFAYQNFPEQVRALAASPAALLTACFIGAVLVFYLMMVSLAASRWEREGRFQRTGVRRAA